MRQNILACAPRGTLSEPQVEYARTRIAEAGLENVAKIELRNGSFIEQYIFPDGDLPPLPIMLGAAESAGFEIREVENLREHYPLTLRHWLRRLEAHHDEVRRFVDESTYRVWRLYLAGSAHGFRRGYLAVYQTLLAKIGRSGEANLPLTRGDCYEQERRC